MSGVYKLFDRGQLVGVFTAKEIAEKIGCSDQTVFKYERSGKLWKDRWMIEYREKQNTERAAWVGVWSNQWRIETARWKKSGHDLAKIRIVGKD